MGKLVFVIVSVLIFSCKHASSALNVNNGILDHEVRYSFVGAIIVDDPEDSLRHLYRSGRRADESRVLCSGALLCPNVILTAAHCSWDYWSKLKNYRFSNQYAVYEDDNPIKITSFWIHPKYIHGRRETISNDVGLVRLESNVKLDQYPTLSDFVPQNKGAVSIVIGYGQDGHNPADGRRRSGHMDFEKIRTDLNDPMLVYLPSVRNQHPLSNDSGAPIAIGGDPYKIIGVNRGGYAKWFTTYFTVASVKENNPELKDKISKWCSPWLDPTFQN